MSNQPTAQITKNKSMSPIQQVANHWMKQTMTKSFSKIRKQLKEDSGEKKKG